MATSAESVTTDLTTCPICLEVFDDPKSLPCLHSFCLKCLQGQFKDKSIGDDVHCPACTENFEIPAEGLDGLRHKFFIQKLIDVRKVSSEEFHEVPCVVCLEESDGSSEQIAAATTYCVDCKQKLCERCSRPHRRWAGGAHQLKCLGAEVEQELIQLRAGACDKHKDEQVKLYCHQCNENICLMCSAVKHRNHESSEIPDAADNFRSRIDADDQQVFSVMSAFFNHSTQIQHDLSKFLNQADRTVKTIYERGDEIKRLVNKQVSELVSKVQSAKSDTKKQAHAVQDRLQLALVAMESFHAYSRELLEKGQPSDVTREASELHTRATELLHHDVTTFNFRPRRVTFTSVDITELNNSNLVGTFRDFPGTTKHIVRRLSVLTCSVSVVLVVIPYC